MNHFSKKKNCIDGLIVAMCYIFDSEALFKNMDLMG